MPPPSALLEPLLGHPEPVVVHFDDGVAVRAARVRIVMRPSPTLRDRPCLIEFSTSGCRIMLGTMTSSVSGLICLSTLQLRTEADDLDVEVLVDRLELLAQRDEVIRAAHQAAQQARELRDEHARRLGLRADERRDRRQRVEQEVRVDLVGQRLDLAPPAAASPAPASRCSMRALFQILIGVATPSTVASRTTASVHERAGRRQVEQPVVLAPARAERLAQQLERDRRQQQHDLPVDLRRSRSIRQARRWRPVKTNGEKCQIASFGQSSRRPPPAKPQPTAKGSAMNSPATSGGQADHARRRWRRRTGPAMRPARNAPSSVRSAAL